MKNSWVKEPPAEPGAYWFYGEPWLGSMGIDYTEAGRIIQNKLYYVEVRKIANRLTAITSGQFMELAVFDKENHRSGHRGYWRKVEPIALPEITE